MKPFRILAFDTTSCGLSVTILSENKIIANKDIAANNMQAEILVPTIEECLNESGIWYQDLNLIAVTNGPGSFTAIRVGFATAKAIKLATTLPLITVSALEVIANNYKNGIYNQEKYKKILVIIDAKLDEFFIQEFSISSNIVTSLYEPKLINIAEIKNFLPTEKFLLAGNVKSLIEDQLKNHQFICAPEDDFVKASDLAFLAQDIYKNHSQQTDQEALYIRKPRISKRKDKSSL